MKNILTLLLLVCCSALSAQRIVFPGQELLFPHLNDPSYIGKSGDVTAMGMLQITDFERKQHSQFINAQLPISENLSFGVDYFKDALDFYNYSTAMASAVYKIDLGETDSYINFGFSGGIDSRRQDRFPIDEIPNMEEFVPRINESDVGFTYRLGAHYNWNNLTIGGTYNRLPIQSVLVRNNIEDLIGYWIKDGFTANVKYGLDISETFRLTPIFRYLSYADEAIYEGALLVDVGNYLRASVSYKNDYSINPAVQFELFEALQIGYSYEKSMGNLNFEDVHSLSLSYKIRQNESSSEPEWLKEAEETNKKVDAIKPQKEKKPKSEPEVIAEEMPKVEVKEPAQAKEKQEVPVQKEPEAIKVAPVVVEEAPKPTVEKQEVPVQKEPEPIKEAPVVVEEIPEPISVEEITEPVKVAPVAVETPEPISVEEEQPSEAEFMEEKQQKVVTSSKTSTDGSMLARGYYIVVGTFDSLAKAKAEKQRLTKLDYYIVIGTEAGVSKFYLYVDSDRTKADAQKRLRAHKLDRNFRNAYLLEIN